MEVDAWNNGSHNPTGSGYGLKVVFEDRDKFYKREWGGKMTSEDLILRE